VAISIYYYFGWIRECYFSAPTSAISDDPRRESFSAGDAFLLAALVGGIVLLGLLPAALPIIP